MTKHLLIVAAAVAVLAASTASAATFVVRSDRDLGQQAHAIIVGDVVSSYSRLNDAGGIETVTTISVVESIKGNVSSATVDLVEPGGAVGDLVSIIPGSPQFTLGQRTLLFLMKTGADRWATLDLVVGKFKFADDVKGQRLLVRDEDEIVGWDTNLQPHVEQRRSAERFLDFVRGEARGRAMANDYVVPAAPLKESGPAPKTPRATATALQPAPLVAPYTATSYTMTISGSMGSRWNVFPNPVNFTMGTTQEPGAPGGGSTAIQAGIAAWDNDAGSNVNYVYAGVDNGTHSSGLHGADGANTVLFERDLSTWGASPFSCGSGGTLGLGGITTASGNNTVNGETFVTTQEGDVEMNKGIANCSSLFTSGDFNSAVAHELGHTLGFRHSDQNRASSGACTGDPSLECASVAIMTSSVPGGINGTLQQWDVNAVRAVYPGSTPPPCAKPTVTASASPSSISAGQSATLTATTTNTTSLQWYIGQAGDTSRPVPGGGSNMLAVSPSSTTSYWAWALNSCGTSTVSNTVTVTVTAACTKPTVTVSPSNTTINQGQGVTLTASEANVTSQQWYVGQAGDTSHPISGAGGSSITVAPQSTTSYWVWVLNSCASTVSNTATVNVNSCPQPTATVSPSSTTINQGQSTTLTVSETNATAQQWYMGQAGDTSHPVSGGGGTSITVAPSTTTSYWVWALNGCGKSVVSNTATVNVNSCPQPTATVSPSSVTINAGQSTTLTVSETNTTGQQWYIGQAGDTSHPVSGGGGTSITVAPSTTTSYWVWALNGCGKSVISNTATVTVH